jgi:2-isopropylmalate synthase
MNRKIDLYDTTLRDGMQGEGLSLSAAEKLNVCRALDRLGIHFIEAGFPSSNPKEAELFELLESEQFENSVICAFGMTRRRDLAPGEDAALRMLAESFSSERPGSCTWTRSSGPIPRTICG